MTVESFTLGAGLWRRLPEEIGTEFGVAEWREKLFECRSKTLSAASGRLLRSAAIRNDFVDDDLNGTIDPKYHAVVSSTGDDYARNPFCEFIDFLLSQRFLPSD